MARRCGSSFGPGVEARLLRQCAKAGAGRCGYAARKPIRLCGSPVSPDADGANRARSATEAFLYRRLETLPETKGRFRLNVALAIAFDGFGQLEVDLHCADARVAVELDGAQHLADPVAYRRDRRKDQLLQESGHLVLRFLAEDVGKELDAVLDAILRALSHRRPAVPITETLQFVRRGRT